MDSTIITTKDRSVGRHSRLSQLLAFAEKTDFKIVDGNGALYLLNQALSLVDDNSQANTATLPLLVSIDTEFSKECIFELGISTFDPQHLSSICQAPVEDPEEIIFSFCYTKAEVKSRRRKKPYLFGPRQDFDNASLPGLIINTLSPKDIHETPRDVILIGHSIKSDINVLEQFSRLNLRSAPNVRAIIDTQTVSNTVLGSTQSVSLKSLLTYLGLEYTGLHNAAHDSRYTLRALLMMYCICKQTYLDETEETYSSSVARLDLIERVARSHRATTPDTSCGPNDWTDNIDPRLMRENLDKERDSSFSRHSTVLGDVS